MHRKEEDFCFSEEEIDRQFFLLKVPIKKLAQVELGDTLLCLVERIHQVFVKSSRKETHRLSFGGPSSVSERKNQPSACEK